MGETEIHRDNMIDLIQTLTDYVADEPMVYVSGWLLVFYVEGIPLQRVAPDVFVVRGVEKKRRDDYLVWKEGRAPNLVIELTSKSTQNEDKKKKWTIYRDILRVSEYFLFDPTSDYLDPPLQGFRLVAGEYVRIEPVDGRLPSEVLGLHLEQVGDQLRLFDPVTGTHLPTRTENRDNAKRRAEAEQQRAEAVEAVRKQLAEENERLRRELEALRHAADGE
jgi:Uma2 family endonuclease